jgi:hypothetical protein
MPEKKTENGVTLGNGMAEKARVQLSGRQKRIDDAIAAMLGETPKKSSK